MQAELQTYEHASSEPDAVWQGLLETAAPRGNFEGALLALAVWLRYSAARWLTWNANYNVKPREISAAQVWSASCTEHSGTSDSGTHCRITIQQPWVR